MFIHPQQVSAVMVLTFNSVEVLVSNDVSLGVIWTVCNSFSWTSTKIIYL